MCILNHEYCIHPLNYVLEWLQKYINLVDIGEILPMVPQIGVKTCLNTHFWGNKSKFRFIPCRMSNLWVWTGEIIEISIISLPSLVILTPVW